jgi:hypothetical protein
MPSSLNRGYPKANATRVQGTNQVPPGQKYSIVPDIIMPLRLAAGDAGSANTGFFVLVCPTAMVFLGGDEIHTTLGTNSFRVKKVLAAATTGPAGAAADVNNVDISAVVAVTGANNTVQQITPVWPACLLAAGDKVAIASSAGIATLAGGSVTLRFAVL